MVRADELYNEVMAEATAKGASQGMFIGCSVDTSTGTVAFTCEGKENSIKFKVSKIFAFRSRGKRDGIGFDSHAIC